MTNQERKHISDAVALVGKLGARVDALEARIAELETVVSGKAVITVAQILEKASEAPATLAPMNIPSPPPPVNISPQRIVRPFLNGYDGMG